MSRLWPLTKIKKSKELQKQYIYNSNYKTIGASKLSKMVQHDVLYKMNNMCEYFQTKRYFQNSLVSFLSNLRFDDFFNIFNSSYLRFTCHWTGNLFSSAYNSFIYHLFSFSNCYRTGGRFDWYFWEY